ncbi:MAG: polyribonucleotide nucleotidyltransferase [Candidatus Daviesbacteria bacterium]|nr:polyribonucleotide nucleotidyltransferase [Candidatus Daviesbacteria bacterium]
MDSRFRENDRKKLMNKVVIKELDLNGRKLTLETGKLAQAADAAVLASWGDTVVLCTVASKPLTQDMGYFPLSVEYVEKYYASGRITAQKFIKRESRPTEDAVLSGRAIDRSIRPFFPKDFQAEVQIIVSVLSYDGSNDPVTLGFIGVSAALSISTVPWNGPLGVTKIVKVGDEILVNPELTQIVSADLELFVASSKERIAMIEAKGKEVPEEVVFAGIKQGHEGSQKIVSLIEEFTKEAGKPKQEFSSLAEQVDEVILKEVKEETKTRIEEALFDETKKWNESTGDFIKAELSKKYAEKLTSVQIAGIFDKVAKSLMNDAILVKGKRVDGRKMDEVRPIEIQLGLLPRTHGSAVFQRGTTQVLSIATLGPLSLSQTLEGMMGEGTKRFMHHYNMSINPFSTGESKRLGAPNRRDIGHGALVEKSLVNVLPSEQDFPYAIRVVSEILAANASTSMASLCASTLALLNAGVKLKNPVAGIALGLLSNDEKFQVITDMQAVEDFYGEMDFKVAGTVNGVTGIQMDTKLEGLSLEMVEQALAQGKTARAQILEKMNEAIPVAGEISKYAPKIEITNILPEEIGLLIGSGGKTINGIIARTGAQIDIEDDGMVMVSSSDDEAIKKALAEIKAMFTKVEVDQEFEGKVVRITTFGAFVELSPGKDGLVHISQMAPQRVERAEDIVSVGQVVKVRVTDVSPEGKIGLSMLFGDDRKPESEGRPSGRPGGGGRDQSAGRQGFGGGRRQDFGRDRPRRR